MASRFGWWCKRDRNKAATTSSQGDGMQLQHRTRIRFTTAVVSAALLAAGCGGGSSDESDGGEIDTAATSSTTTVAETTTTSEAPFDVGDLEASVVKIAADGTFVFPEVGQQTTAGFGTGFVIDDSGLVVTNHHVVAGGAVLQAWTSQSDAAVNARVVGLSECADIAVIDLDGEGYPSLEWFDDEVTVGMDVYAAGFPGTDASSVVDADYTLTSGIVSSVSAAGETPWASVESTVEHDAIIRGGNSGGPLVFAGDGSVVGINFAGRDDGNHSYAIGSDTARQVVEALVAGEEVDSLGVNGFALPIAEYGVAGVWVASVVTGGPADVAGIEPGDVIIELEGIAIGESETMAEYCDVLRTHGSEAPLAVQVIRSAGDGVALYAGAINGEGLVLQDSEPVTGDAYVTVTDDLGVLQVSVPASWDEVVGAESEFGASIFASPDIAGAAGSWDVPAVLFEARPWVDANTPIDLEAVAADLADSVAEGCVYSGRESYDDGVYAGFADLYEACGGTETSLLIVAAEDPVDAVSTRLAVQIVSPVDLEITDVILQSFVVIVPS